MDANWCTYILYNCIVSWYKPSHMADCQTPWILWILVAHFVPGNKSKPSQSCLTSTQGKVVRAVKHVEHSFNSPSISQHLTHLIHLTHLTQLIRWWHDEVNGQDRGDTFREWQSEMDVGCDFWIFQGKAVPPRALPPRSHTTFGASGVFKVESSLATT